MPLKVIGAGYPRTGTMSLKLALEELGFGPCHHMVEVFSHPEQWPLWERVYDGLPFDWDDVLKGYNSATDAPTCFFYKELAARYPDAKVILSLRSADSWWRSASSTVMAPGNQERMAGSPMAPMMMKMQAYMAKRESLMGSRGSYPPTEAEAKAAFEAHNAEVLRTIPKERLLVFEAKQGWAPLCKFLGVPVPKTPYPHVNSTEEFGKTAARIPSAPGAHA